MDFGNIHKFLSYTFITVLTLIFLFCLGDFITLKVIGKNVSPFVGLNDPKGRVIKPYVMFGGAPHASIEIFGGEQLNELGYRGPFPEKTKKADEFRIFLLGSSAVMLGSPSLSSLLQDIFKNAGHENVKIYNFGSISSETGQSLARILYEMYDLKPDLIVMYEGGNDIMDRFLVDPRPGYPYNFVVYEKNPLLVSNHIEDYPLFSLMAMKSVIFRFKAKNFIKKNILKINQLRKEVGFGSEQWKNTIVESYLTNTQKAKVLSEAIGSGYLAIFQPLLCTKEIFTEQEKNYLQTDTKNYCLEMIHKMRQEIKDLQSNNFPILDYSEVFDQRNDQIFEDYIHIVDDANKIIAQKMYEDIQSINRE